MRWIDRWSVCVVLVPAALACNSSHDSGTIDRFIQLPDAGTLPADSGPSGSAAGLDAAVDDGGSIGRIRELVPRECGAKPIGPEIEIVPGLFCGSPRAGDPLQCTSGIQCLGPWDCEPVPFARCLGQASKVCVYPGSEAGMMQPPPCDTDADCGQRANGRCDLAITHAVCQYNAECEQDADCGPGARCACGLSGDPICVTAECRQDADCPGQHCKRDYTCGYPVGGFYCTRPDDACRSDSDCAAGRCEFDETQGRWQCSNTPPCTFP